jgi:predicted RNA-binding Zn-ribbon protein involved in translation (DUF1610 family)
MSETIFKPSITSRPIYGQLTPEIGGDHLLVFDAQGVKAVLDLSTKVGNDFFSNAHIIYIPKESGEAHLAELKVLRVKELNIENSIAEALLKMQSILSNANNSLQIYLSGSEGLIGQASYKANTFNYPYSAIQTEHRGSKARRMQCVHCKGITENVTVDPFVCSNCGLNLFVRDHYSRRLAAFQAVCVDAEEPGNIPEQVEID